MPPKSLLEFEQYFAQQLTVLDQIPWATLRIKLLDKIVRKIRETFPEAERQSYLAELAPIVIHLFQTASDQLHSVDPAMLEDALRWVQGDQFFQQLTETGKQQELQKIAAEIIAQSYFRVGDTASLHEFLLSQEMLPEDSSERPPENRRDYIEQYEFRLPSMIAEALCQELEPPRYAADHILGLFAVATDDIRAGVMGTISLEDIEITNERGPDQLRIATHLVQEQDIIASQTQAICQYLRAHADISDKMRVRLKFGLDQPSSLLTGNSAGLALTLLGELGLKDRTENSRRQLQISQQVAFTGAMDREGHVREVEDDDIPVKIEAAFFGSAMTVIIPERHKDTAQQKLASLHERYPNRDLMIQGVSHIDEVKKQSEIIRARTRTLTERFRQFLNFYAIPLSFAAILFFTLGSIGVYEFVIKDEIPTTLDIQKNRIVVKNKFGFILWRSEPYGSGEVAQHFRDLAQIEDIDNDGDFEVLLSYDESTIQGFRSSVVCYQARGVIGWKRNTYFPIRYEDRTFTSVRNIAMLQTKDFNGDGKKEVVALTTSQSEFPSRVQVFSHSGEPLSDYWHTGELQPSIAVKEIYENNQTKELILSGTNEEYKTGVLLALDPFCTHGTSHQQHPYYRPSDVLPGNEIYYVRLPETHFLTQFTRDYAVLSSQANSPGLHLDLLNQASAQFVEQDSCIGIHYTFGAELAVDSVGVTGDYFDLYHKAFPDYESLAKDDPTLIGRFERVQYWNGSVWADTPQVNQNYIETTENGEALSATR